MFDPAHTMQAFALLKVDTILQTHPLQAVFHVMDLGGPKKPTKNNFKQKDAGGIRRVI